MTGDLIALRKKCKFASEPGKKRIKLQNHSIEIKQCEFSIEFEDIAMDSIKVQLFVESKCRFQLQHILISISLRFSFFLAFNALRSWLNSSWFLLSLLQR